MTRQCWLMKTEPSTFSMEDLLARPQRREPWDGVRNYEARNTMRDRMRQGDEVLIYHSGGAAPAVVGEARVASTARPDPTQFDSASPHFDAAARRDAPRWFLVDIEGVRTLERPVGLQEIKAHPALAAMALARRGQRLSILPVLPEHYDMIVAAARAPAP